MSFTRTYERDTATIPSGSATSSAVDARAHALFGIVLPSTFDGTSLTITVSTSETGTFQTLEDQYGSAITLTVEASRSYALPNDVAAWPWFKLVAGSNQTTTDTVITVVKKA